MDLEFESIDKFVRLMNKTKDDENDALKRN
jgi:hypothetical protein